MEIQIEGANAISVLVRCSNISFYAKPTCSRSPVCAWISEMRQVVNGMEAHQETAYTLGPQEVRTRIYYTSVFWKSLQRTFSTEEPLLRAIWISDGPPFIMTDMSPLVLDTVPGLVPLEVVASQKDCLSSATLRSWCSLDIWATQKVQK